jgi:hypothetical protein
MSSPALLFVSWLVLVSTRAAAQRPMVSDHPNAPAERHVFFGDLHLHTAYSFDAWSLFGTKVTPDQAYKFARGDTVAYLGHNIRRSWPLDFTAVTDHAEYMGVLNQLDDPTSALSQTELGKRILKKPKFAYSEIRRALTSPALVSELNAKAATSDIWKREMSDANSNYKPGRFTTFIAYEWSSMAQDRYNLHRNVIFRNDDAPSPFSATDSKKPEDLWSYLERARSNGYDVIAIPHNANASGGLMFDWNGSDGRPIDQIYAQRRALNEPLTEIYQTKGQSETISQLSSADEFADFEVVDELLRLWTTPGVKSAPNGSYVRQALGRGLILQQRVGANPFKLGFVGATDLHNGLSTQDENAYAGGISGVDPNQTLPDGDNAKRALGLMPPANGDVDKSMLNYTPDAVNYTPDVTMWGSGGLTGVWAEANTREAIFAALRRKETFATSGPRISVRAFGGWNFDPAMLTESNWVRAAYAEGTPMGGDLPARPARAASLSFIIQAIKAPDSGNLDRIQMIKVWLDGTGYKEKVFDVALSGNRKPDPHTGKALPVGSTVDLATGTYTNTIGATQLQAVWKDPEFDPAHPAVYYVRVLEIPTPRWTTLLAARRHLPLPTTHAATLQERAWASPIWYMPQN